MCNRFEFVEDRRIGEDNRGRRDERVGANRIGEAAIVAAIMIVNAEAGRAANLGLEGACPRDRILG
jgi:hypothetical protein